MKDKKLLHGLLLCAAVVYVPLVIAAECGQKASNANKYCSGGAGDSCSFTEYDQNVLCISGSQSEKCEAEANVNAKSRLVNGSSCSGNVCGGTLSYPYGWSDGADTAGAGTYSCGGTGA